MRNIISLFPPSWTLAKAQLHLAVAASASINAQAPGLKDNEDLLCKDIWVQMGRNFRIFFHISFNDCFSDCSGREREALHGSIFTALTQAPLWSQLHLVASSSAHDHTIDSSGATEGILTLKLDHGRSSGFDLSKVTAPEGITAVYLASVRISLNFSSIHAAPRKSHNISSTFEDLLSPRHDDYISDLVMVISDRQGEEKSKLEDCEDILDPLQNHPVRQLLDVDWVERPKRLILSDPEQPYLPGFSIQSLETRLSNYSSQASNKECRFEKDVALHPSETDATRASSTIPTSNLLNSYSSCFTGSAKRGIGGATASSPVYDPELRQNTTEISKSVNSLADAALRSLIHPKPTRLSACLRFSRPSSASDFCPGQDTPKAASLSELAPSIFAPGYAQAVVERAPLVASIAKSLTTFLRYRSQPEAKEVGNDDLREVSKDKGMEQTLKEVLRGHVWRTMANGLRGSYQEKARKLKPLAMPRRQGEQQEQTIGTDDEEEADMLEEKLASNLKGTTYDGEDGELEDEVILEGLGSENFCAVEEDFSDELLFDGEEMDFEELCLLERSADCSAQDTLEDCIEVDGDVDDMLF